MCLFYSIGFVAIDDLAGRIPLNVSGYRCTFKTEAEVKCVLNSHRLCYFTEPMGTRAVYRRLDYNKNVYWHCAESNVSHDTAQVRFCARISVGGSNGGINVAVNGSLGEDLFGYTADSMMNKTKSVIDHICSEVCATKWQFQIEAIVLADERVEYECTCLNGIN